MNPRDFENQARRYAVGVLDEDELETFEQARQQLGPRAEQVIRDSQRLVAAFALSLPPCPPSPETKQRLLTTIRAGFHDR